MSTATSTEIGAVVSLWRYPVKSMLGEEVLTAQVTDHGLLGDRAYALLDRADGPVAFLSARPYCALPSMPWSGIIRALPLDTR